MAEDGLTDHLQRLGASRIEAMLVLHLLRHSQTSTAAIIEATGLRQPEVSVGMRDLRRRGWVATRTLPREGKGRPMHGYELALTPSDVVAHYRATGQAELDAYASAMAALDALT